MDLTQQERLFLDGIKSRVTSTAQAGLRETALNEAENLKGEIYEGYSGWLQKNMTPSIHYQPPSSDTLSGYFKTLAVDAGAVLLHKPSPALTSIMEHDEMPGHNDEYGPRTIGAGKFAMSFLRLNEDEAGFTIEMPLFILDAALARDAGLSPDDGVIKALGDLVATCNHDYLHQWTNKNIYDMLSTRGKSTEEWREYFPHHETGGDPGKAYSYESFLIQSHARIWKAGDEKLGKQRFPELADKFFTELEGLKAKLAQSDLPLKRQHEIIDYLGLVGASPLTYLAPIDDPQLTNYLKRLQTIDPAPELLWRDMAKLKSINLPESASDERVRRAANRISDAEGRSKNAMLNFQKVGEAILTKKDEDFDYVHAKRRQLTHLYPANVNMHSPSERFFGTQDIRKGHVNADDRLRSLPGYLNREVKDILNAEGAPSRDAS